MDAGARPTGWVTRHAWETSRGGSTTQHGPRPGSRRFDRLLLEGQEEAP